MSIDRTGTRRTHSFLHVLGLSLVLITLCACGGGASTQTMPISSTVSSVSAACTPSTVAPNATAQCSATVMGTGSYSPAVTWSASVGAINSSGLFTAPATAVTATVTATSTQDTTKAGTAAVTVKAPASTITSVQAVCNPSTVVATATSQCTATVSGTGSYSSAVTWSASVGAINAGGFFIAPATTGTATITATSVQDTAQSGPATVMVQSPTRHLVMVMEENTGYASVVGNSNWPNLNGLISHGALATNYYANSHPSIGNYFMLTTGQLLTTDDNSTTVWNVDNLARHLLAAGIPFRVYAEGITQGYVGGNIGTYLIRHNPFAMLSDIANNPTVANQTLWPFTQFATDLASGTLPEFSFVVPDVNDDAHNGTPQQADSWLQTNIVTPLSTYPAFQPGGDGVLIVAFDESATSDTTNGGGHIPAVFWGPLAKVGFTQTSSTLYQHQSILLTVMDTFGLPNPPGAAATAPPMSEFLK